jgi:hypothetical protein
VFDFAWMTVAVLGVTVALPGCHGRETDEVIAGLRADNEELRAQLAAAQAENVMLVEGAAGPTWPGAVTLKRVGGNSGRLLYQRTCPLGQALEGFTARTGSVVDSLVPVCSPLVHIPGTKGTRTLERELAIVGGRGGRVVETLCPGDTHLVGVRGRSADVVDALQPVCEDGKSGARVGGDGGRDYERMCPVGWFAVGLTGRHGDYVESLSLICADPKAAGITPTRASAESPPERPPERPPAAPGDASP